jgi:hypothetical protein
MTTSTFHAPLHAIDELTRRGFLGGVSRATALNLPVPPDRPAPHRIAAVDGNPATTVGQR